MMAESAGTANSWVISGVLVALYMPFLIWMYLKMRSGSRKAKIKRRLLVMEEGQPVWRTVRGALLVGWPGRKQRVHSGPWLRRVTARNGTLAPAGRLFTRPRGSLSYTGSTRSRNPPPA